MRKLCFIAISLAAALQATEMVIFRNGGRLEVERSEREGDGVWLYSRNGSIQLMPGRDITRAR